MCAVYRPPGSTLGYRLSTPEHRGEVYLKAELPSTRGDATISVLPNQSYPQRTGCPAGYYTGHRRRGHTRESPRVRPLSVPQERRCHIRYFLWSSSEGRNTLDSLGKTAVLLTSVRHRTEHKKDPLDMRLNQRRRGDCYYNNNIGATRSQGIWVFSLVILWLLISLCQHQRRRGAPGNHPGYAPLFQTLTSA